MNNEQRIEAEALVGICRSVPEGDAERVTEMYHSVLPNTPIIGGDLFDGSKLLGFNSVENGIAKKLSECALMLTRGMSNVDGVQFRERLTSDLYLQSMLGSSFLMLLDSEDKEELNVVNISAFRVSARRSLVNLGNRERLNYDMGQLEDEISAAISQVNFEFGSAFDC